MITPQPGYKPRALFSISQVEKAFGHGYEQLDLDSSDGTDRMFDLYGLDPAEHGSASGCLRSWGFRYLVGLKEPELTWAEACALPEATDAQRRYKAGAKARTWGKVAEQELERWLRRDASLATHPLDPHVNAGLYLLPPPGNLVSYELQAPVSVRTSPEAIGWGKSAIPSELPGSLPTVSWQGFKDFTGIARHTPGGDVRRFLIDFKTTKPKVDNAYNREHGRPAGFWRYRKTAEDLRLDWQYNLYQWDEYLKNGSFPSARWVYFASPGSEKYPNKPEAHATDPGPADLEIVRSVVRALDARGRVLLGHVRAVQGGADVAEYTASLPGNILACDAFGGCPFSLRNGGPCRIHETGVIPVGRLTGKVKGSERSEPFVVQAFEQKGNTMGVYEEIQAQMARDSAAKQPVQTSPHPGVAQASAVPWKPPAAQAGPFTPRFAFNPTPPVQAPPAAAPTANAFGAQAAPGWCHDGQGGYFPEAQLPAMASAGHPEALALLGRGPTPPGFVAPSPTPGLPPEAFAPGGPVGPPLTEAAPMGAPVPPPIGANATEAGVPKKGRPKGSKNKPTEPASVTYDPSELADTRDTDPAPAMMAWDRIAEALERIATKIGA